MSQDIGWNVFSTGKTHSTAARGASNPNVLKRHQACHQCRRRKLKCDAKRPCSTCVRSHAHAIVHAPKGSQIPAHPDCTFDDDAEPVSIFSGNSSADSLRDPSFDLDGSTNQHNNNSCSSNNRQLPCDSQSPFELDGNNYLPLNPASGLSFFPTTPEVAQMATVPHIPDVDLDSLQPLDSVVPLAVLSPRSDMMWPNWPPNLPSPELMRHLIEIFFTYQIHARRLFHIPTFMNSLTLPPSHPRFPIPPVLHAICAISPMYTAAALTLPSPVGGVFDREKGYRITEQSPESFTEQQAMLAKETIGKYWSTGDRPMQVLQANIVLSWYFWNHAKLFDAWDCSGRSIRMISLLNLNSCSAFEPISAHDLIGARLLPPAESWIEEETRRNAFWLAYTHDRTTSIGSTFAIDHNDLGQFFPIRGDLFHNGEPFPTDHRQWAHTQNVLLVHPENQCDSFTLFIKATMLLTHAKNFNHRFRIHHYANSPRIFPEVLDPPETQAFRNLDKTLSSFRKSFPPSLRHPINGNVVDRHLYGTCLCIPAAIITLHEPYADARNSESVASLKMLTAARDILDLIYNIWSTSYDITLLDLSSTLSWYFAGRVFARCLQIAIETHSQDQIPVLQTELAFVQLAIRKVGERVPLAREHGKNLDKLAVQTCGDYVPIL